MKKAIMLIITAILVASAPLAYASDNITPTSGNTGKGVLGNYNDKGKYLMADTTANSPTPAKTLIWNKFFQGHEQDLAKIAWGKDRFVVVGWKSGIMWSSDGINWNKTNISESLQFIKWDGKQFIAYGQNPEKVTILTSPDGQNWTRHIIDNSTNDLYAISDIAINDDKIVAVGMSGRLFLITDYKNVERIKLNISNSPSFTSALWGGNQFVIGGHGGLLLTSPDGITWSRRDLPYGLNKYPVDSIIYENGKYIAASGPSTILTSPDGAIWTKSEVNTLERPTILKWDGQQYFAFCDKGKILVSKDASKWEELNTNKSNWFRGVEINSNKIVAIMGDGSIYASSFENSLGINVVINGKPLNMDVSPIIINDRTLVPMRAVFEALGATVKWDDSSSTITTTRKDKAIVLQINNKSAKVNNKDILLDVPATIIGDRTLVPIRFISESIGAKVEWDDNKRTVSITIEADTLKSDTNKTNIQATTTDSNISNGGHVAYDGDWTYYSYSGMGLNRINYKDNLVQKLCDEDAKNISIHDGWIYCTLHKGSNNYSEDYGIFKMKPDGSLKEKISGDIAGNVHILGDWIYYVKDNMPGTDLYKMKTDGSHNQKILSSVKCLINVTEDWIYYIGGFDNNIMRISCIDSETQFLAKNAAMAVEYNGYIYYYCTLDTISGKMTSGVFRISEDGKEKNFINSDNSASYVLNISNGYIYFTSGRPGTFKMKLDGSQLQKISSDWAFNMGISQDGWIYYSKRAPDGKADKNYYRMKLDGSNKEELKIGGKIR